MLAGRCVWQAVSKNTVIRLLDMRSLRKLAFPEEAVGGYTSVDGTVEFYNRVHALLNSEMIVLDFGSGRGAALLKDKCEHRKKLHEIRDKVKFVVGCDIDEGAANNPRLDTFVLVNANQSLPFADSSFDLVIADFVFEHIGDPDRIAYELRRVVKPGGWICARTPNKHGLISLFTRLINNRYHVKLLSFVQPHRHAVDVFPTCFLLNSLSDIRQHFPPHLFENYTYRYEAEPSYYFNKDIIFAVLLFLNWLLPSVMKSSLFVFLRKKVV